MKIVYCICSLYNPGGMERVLLNKVTYLVEKMHWEVVVVTTDQHGLPPFYPFPKQVRLINLDINYSDDNHQSLYTKVSGYLKRKKKHRKRLTELLTKERADIVVSLYPSESSFIPDIKDGSKKVLELHYCKFFRLQYNRKGLLRLIDRFRTYQDERIVRKFDKFVVLTTEDKGYWGNLPNIIVIPNAARTLTTHISDSSIKRVLAVGRLDYQKGFDRLINAWSLVHKRTNKYQDWKLDIYGQGEDYDKLKALIDKNELFSSVRINQPTKTIGEEYVRSSFLVMSSHYEGFPMVMIEAMACGLPVVSFDFKCGPKDIIQDGENGLLVRDGDIDGLASAMIALMDSLSYRRRLSAKAALITNTYAEDVVMDQWLRLFTSLEKS